ncbi:heme-binding protein [Mycolicibacterium palauense]|uniref:heme-binding protein n=1 Tax=Mycolicibacterium palauense TaxID=2034511 RepID=UPI000BFEC03B|nr:heme-binding protein [Mycolicibacterium palauense]
MSPPARRPRRTVLALVGGTAVAGATLLGAAPLAAAEPPVPPPCSAAELARVMSGVTFETSNYLTTHPAVNDFFTGLKGQPKDQIGPQVRIYLDANPTVKADLQRIRQPAADFHQRCGVPPVP